MEKWRQQEEPNQSPRGSTEPLIETSAKGANCGARSIAPLGFPRELRSHAPRSGRWRAFCGDFQQHSNLFQAVPRGVPNSKPETYRKTVFSGFLQFFALFCATTTRASDACLFKSLFDP